jgi:hypothetical protein
MYYAGESLTSVSFKAVSAPHLMDLDLLLFTPDIPKLQSAA